jgi:hypothetical protein
MLLKGGHELFQFVLGEIGQTSLWQVWAATLEGRILGDELFEHLQHFARRLSSHCDYEACASSLYTDARPILSAFAMSEGRTPWAFSSRTREASIDGGAMDGPTPPSDHAPTSRAVNCDLSRPRTVVVSVPSGLLHVLAAGAERTSRLPSSPRERPLADAHTFDVHSAFTDCTVHVVGMLPTLAVDETVVPLMNHITVSPVLLRHSRSLFPSPL